ncbi:MAG: hypothetical protein AUJ01_04885 [Acidobacteria bacterium 13_1_40CM_3_65_5]|nr:MAG: hypothetical protein AUJ01_04885 [Acidobacteria bacterium 13_1_40CM_3_65_5]
MIWANAASGAAAISAAHAARLAASLLGLTTGPLRSHPTAQACAVGTTRCRGPTIAADGSL